MATRALVRKGTKALRGKVVKGRPKLRTNRGGTKKRIRIVGVGAKKAIATAVGLQAATGAAGAYGAHKLGGSKRRKSKKRTAAVTAGGFLVAGPVGAATAYGTHKYLNRKRKKTRRRK